MKALKIIGIIVGVLIAAILIIPLFISSPAVVEVRTEIALEPRQIFPSVASYENRAEWDPWLNTDTTATATFESKPGFVGSTYQWEGEQLGRGKMEVLSVEENRYIESSLWFGEVQTPSLVEWEFDQVDGGTQVTWRFTEETRYPFHRLGMVFGKMFLQQSFEMGLAGLKEYMEANPPANTPYGPIGTARQEAMEALVAEGSGTMIEMSRTLPDLFMALGAELEKQQLQMAGPAFVHYLDFDPATNRSHYLAGIPVDRKGMDGGGVMARSYPEMEVVRTIHSGPYERFQESYNAMEQYIGEQGIAVTGEAFEFYTVGMQMEQDPSRWRTVIAFPVQ